MTATRSGSGVGVFGKLGNVTLHDLIQMLSLGRRSATLTLRRGDAHGHMYFHDGHILHAEAGPFEGEDGILELLQWQDAEFRIEDGVDSLPRVTIGKKVEAVLLGTLTRLDHMNQLEATARTLPGVPAPVPELAEDTRTPPAPGLGRSASTTRRYPRRPPGGRRRRTHRSLSAAALLLALAALGGASFLLAPYAAAAFAPWMAEPWRELPSVPPPTVHAVVVGSPTLARDAWSLLAETRAAAPIAPEPEPPPAPSAPAPEIAPAPAPGFLTVVVEPWGRVFIDDRLAGETPLARQELPPGEHRLRLENDAVVGVVQDRVDIEPGETLLRRYDFQKVGDLQFLVRPWAEVSVDGRSVGQTPLARVSVPVGPHTVVFEHPRFGREERTVDVRLDETTVVELDWEEGR